MYPKNYKYTKEHEWAELISDTEIRVGITDHAQNSLGDIVFLELPSAGKELQQNQTFGVVESIKAVSDLYSPVHGKVKANHQELTQDPGRINQNPHTEWLIVVEATNAKEQFEKLMNSDEYEAWVKTLN